MGWALFEFLMLFALVRWSRVKDPQWLVLSEGSLAGLAASTKYLAWQGCFLRCSAGCARREGNRAASEPGRALLRFTLPALAVCAPWYLRNTIWLGDPVYPFLSGGEGTWGAGRLGLLLSYLRSFGAGASLLDYLLLPIRLYTDHGLFDLIND